MTKAELVELLEVYDDDAELTAGELSRLAREYEREKYEAREEFIEMLEERQEQSGFYAFQDAMWNWRNERM